jgi:hypothetical protein
MPSPIEAKEVLFKGGITKKPKNAFQVLHRLSAIGKKVLTTYRDCLFE